MTTSEQTTGRQFQIPDRFPWRSHFTLAECAEMRRLMTLTSESEILYNMARKQLGKGAIEIRAWLMRNGHVPPPL